MSDEINEVSNDEEVGKIYFWNQVSCACKKGYYNYQYWLLNIVVVTFHVKIILYLQVVYNISYYNCYHDISTNYDESKTIID